MHKVVKILGKSTTFFLFFFTQICFLAFLTFVQPSLLGIILLMLYIIANYFSWVVLDIVIEDYSEDKKSGRIRGFHLMVLSAGVLIGPFVSTTILSRVGFNGLFIAAIILNAAMFIVGLIGLSGVNGKFRGNLTIRDIGMKILTNRDVLNIYVISLALEAFYALMIVYSPLYLLGLGLSWQQIGIIFTIMLIPFVLLDYPLGKLSDKIGEKKLLLAGFLIAIIFTLIIPFITIPAVWLWALVLFGTRVGAGTIEVMAESYFFKEVSERNSDEISFFRNTYPLSFVIAPLVAIPVLPFVPSFKYLFFVLGAIMLFGLFIALRLKDIK